MTVERSLQPNLRSLLADTGQFLASLLVGPKAAASARSRLSKSSRLALYRLLYIVFSYIENAEVSERAVTRHCEQEVDHGKGSIP